MNDFDNKIIELINKDNSELLDPFHLVFPIPGMWHFIFGAISALVAFLGVIAIILCSRGYLFPAKLILLYAIMSLVFLSAIYFFGYSMGIAELVMLIFGLIALYLLTHRMNRTLLIINAIRHQKIRESKKDGTFEQKRAEARAKYKM